MNKKHEPLFACFVCRDERTFPADHLRTHDGELWCADHWDYNNSDAEIEIDFIDLPQFVPEADQKIQVLYDALNAIKRHVEMSDVQDLSITWNIAVAALNKVEEIGK